MESYPGGESRHNGGGWEKIDEAESALEQRHGIELAKVEMDLAGNP
jgi:hypothetical protein